MMSCFTIKCTMAQISESSIWKEFANNDLTHSWAHYLTAIFALLEQQGYARLSDVAKRLGISKGSLSTSLKPLLKNGMVIENGNKHLSLSADGRLLAMRVQKTFSVMHYLLADLLEVDPQTAQADACKIEHLLSEESAMQLLKMVKALKANDILKNSLLREMNSRHDCTLKCIISEKEDDICTH